MASVKVEGLPELLRKIGRIENPKKQKATFRSVLGAGATVVRKNMRSAVKSSQSRDASGSTLDAVDTKVKIYKDGNAFAIIGVRRGTRGTYYIRTGGGGTRKHLPSKTFHLFDAGTKQHVQPDAHRFVNVNGARVLIPVGARTHPGSDAANIIRKSVMRSRTTAPAAMAKRYRKRILVEAKKRA